MTKGNGLPCKKCGTSKWKKSGHCIECKRESNKQWSSRNSEKEKESKRKWKKNNPEKVKGDNRRWHRSNKDKKRMYENIRRTRKSGAGGSFTTSEFRDLCNQYNNMCVCCGKSTKLTADHIVPVSKGGSSNITNMQPLCQPCNSRKKDKTKDYRTKLSILRWIQDSLF